MAIESLRDVARAGVSAFAGGAAYFGNTAPDPAVFPRWYLLNGTYFEWDGAAWFQPPGTPGQDGVDGEDGAAGANGVGVPTGGTAGQLLSKTSGADFETQWVTPPSSGVTASNIRAQTLLGL